MAKLAHFFLNVDMRCGHKGLHELVKKKKIRMTANDFIVFLNTQKNIIKMFCGDQHALMHYRKDRGTIDLGVIKYLPKYAGGGELRMNAALKEHLLEVLKKKRNNSTHRSKNENTTQEAAHI